MLLHLRVLISSGFYEELLTFIISDICIGCYFDSESYVRRMASGKQPSFIFQKEILFLEFGDRNGSQ